MDFLKKYEDKLNKEFSVFGINFDFATEKKEDLYSIKTWKPHSGTQTEVFNSILSCDIVEIANGGVRGTGKTEVGIWGVVWLMFNQADKFNGIYLRNKSSQLHEIITRFKNNLIKEGFKPKKDFFWDGQLRVLSLKNGASLRFFYVENNGLDSLQGGNISCVVMEEPQQFKKIEETLGKVKALLRTANDISLKVIWLFNPLGPSTKYLKKQYVDLGNGTIANGDFGKKIFYFASTKDNPSVGADYYKRLESLPEYMRKAWLEGDFDIKSGIAFPDLNLLNNGFNPIKMDRSFKPDAYPWYMSLDWGFQQPSAVGFYCLYKNTVVIKFDELLFNGKTGREAGYLIKEYMSKYDTGNFKFGVADTDIWTQSQGPSVANDMADLKLYWLKANKERESGFLRMYDAIKQRRFLAYENLHHFWSTVPELIHSDLKADIEQNPKQEDHVYDETRYMLMSIDFLKPSVKTY